MESKLRSNREKAPDRGRKGRAKGLVYLAIKTKIPPPQE